MSFIDEYPTIKTPQEEMELKTNLVSLIRSGLKKTAQERTKGLVLTEEQIEKIISKVKELKFDRISTATLGGIIDRALKNSNDPEIQSILAQQLKVFNAKQSEFKKSEEYEAAQEIIKNHPNLKNKIMTAFDISMIEEKEDGTLNMYCYCDESKFISCKYDNAAIVTREGKATIKILEIDDGVEML